MSYALLKQNRDVLASYKVGQNVIIHQQPASTHNKKYGTVVGFSLNPLNEVILDVRIACLPMTEPQVESFHPLNQTFTIEIVC